MMGSQLDWPPAWPPTPDLRPDEARHLHRAHHHGVIRNQYGHGTRTVAFQQPESADLMHKQRCRTWLGGVTA
jgi:hypothetical protein